MARDENVTVVRGKQGAMQTINIWELVVGDVILLSAGDKVPADCIIIDSQSLEVDEPGVSHTLQKDATNDPFLKAESFIREGRARVLVACVG